MGLRYFFRNLFALPEPITDPTFGPIFDNYGTWAGDQCRISGVSNPVGIIVPGDSDGPFDSSRRDFQDIVNQLPSLNDKAAVKLFDLCTEQIDPDESIREPSDVWSIATLTLIDVGPCSGPTPCDFELGYSIEWDPEHTYRARFKDEEILEFYADG